MTFERPLPELLSTSSESPAGETRSCFYAKTLHHLYEVADAAFASGGTSKIVPLKLAPRTKSSATADPEVIASMSDAPALRALEQLRGWLHLSYEQLGAVVGISPSVIYHWRRRHRENAPVRPRASSVEQLWRVHSALRAVAEALDGDDSGYGVQMWARSARDGASPLDLLLHGRIEEVEKRAGTLLFERDTPLQPRWQLATPEFDEDDSSLSPGPVAEFEDSDFG
ncbi:helix-turn-helix domain-containing protein [Solirubrobacter pauli]|uniref:helix-turn-helix domain-containing protein n=1 Tax=Solirubrobacter pauli TaxID=166793 RepID=UPI0011C45C91|nr:helix-turn-helix transcriptional regulator [Solirubrobacter pauli]